MTTDMGKQPLEVTNLDTPDDFSSLRIPRRPQLTEEQRCQRQTPFTVAHEWQFKSLFAHGWAISEGWNEIIKAVIDDIEAMITEPVDRTIFSWLQIKEKLGGLRMYARFGLDVDARMISSDQDAPDLLDALKIMAGDRLIIDKSGIRLTIPVELRERILARIRDAETRCAQTCEVCGAPGMLYRDNWWRVRCDAHANHSYGSEGES